MKRYIFLITILLAVVISSCEKEDTTYPIAVFNSDSKIREGFKIILDASGSFSETENDVLQYRWDLNGDHVEWETDWSYSPTLTTVYAPRYESIIGLQVKNSDGKITEIYRSMRLHYNHFNIGYIYDENTSIRYISYYWGSNSEYALTYYWAYDNILYPSSESVYNFSEVQKYASYGSLMNWEKANHLDVAFYHLPTVEEWEHIFEYFGGEQLAGFNLQTVVEHGLQLKLAGIHKNGQLSELDETGYYWTATEASATTAYAVKISKDVDEVIIVELPKTAKASVRIMNEHYQYFK